VSRIEDRFWSKVEVRQAGECWPWQRATDQHGYGNFWVPAGELGLTRGRVIKAHRVAFLLTHGRWPTPNALHGCDEPSCCNAGNPEHVHEGDHSMNMQERFQRGRWMEAGEANPRASLTNDQAAEIRLRYAAGGVLQRELAVEFGVSRQAIGFIVNGKTY
jgi:DNA-binding XRE family transcriptional regulator